MRKMVCLFALYLIAIGLVFAQNKDNQQVPDGMESIKIGGENLIVPKGAKIIQRGSLTMIEDQSVYMGRRLSAIEEHMAAIEGRIEGIEKKMEYIQNTVNTLKEQSAKDNNTK